MCLSLSDYLSLSESNSVVSNCFLPHRLYGPMEFSKPEHWSGWPFPSPGDLPNPRSEPRSPTVQADSLPAEPPGKPSLCLSDSVSLYFYPCLCLCLSDSSCVSLSPHLCISLSCFQLCMVRITVSPPTSGSSKKKTLLRAGT